MQSNFEQGPGSKNGSTARAKSCEPKGQAMPSRAAHARRRMRLMVIEDSPIVREQLAKLASKNEAIELVGCAENGLQGCQMFVALRPDVVLLDLRLPGISGFDLIRMFKRERPECVVIVLTTFADDLVRARCLNL
ncbi:MAG: response regulator transcription factor, partial [Verrucomicrobiae bacterium]|nr:response regulator transcription factor [Verrucomicrobiae bacterium]